MSTPGILTRGLSGGLQAIGNLLLAGILPGPPSPDPGGGGPSTTTGVPLVTITTWDMFNRMRVILNTATWLAGATVRLNQANIDITPALLLADMTEANYDGYAPIALTATATAYLSGAGDYVLQYPHAIFQPTGSLVVNTIYGAWVQGVMGGVGERLLWAVQFDEPVSMTGITSVCVVEPRVIFGQPRSNG